MQSLKRKESKEALMITRDKILEDIMMASLEDKAESKRSFGSRNLEFTNEFNPFYNTLNVDKQTRYDYNQKKYCTISCDSREKLDTDF